MDFSRPRILGLMRPKDPPVVKPSYEHGKKDFFSINQHVDYYGFSAENMISDPNKWWITCEKMMISHRNSQSHQRVWKKMMRWSTKKKKLHVQCVTVTVIKIAGVWWRWIHVNPLNVVIQDEIYHLVTLFTLFTLWNRLVKYWNLASGKRLQFAIASMAI